MGQQRKALIYDAGRAALSGPTLQRGRGAGGVGHCPGPPLPAPILCPSRNEGSEEQQYSLSCGLGNFSLLS